MPAPSPEVLASLLQLGQQLAAAAHGARGALLDGWLAAHGGGISRQTLYRWLEKYAGYAPKRRARSDKGRTCVSEDTLDFIATSVKASARENGITPKPLNVAIDEAEANGLAVPVGRAHVSRLLRSRHTDTRSQRAARSFIRMRSLHPNHVHEIDPSICIVYYMGGRQYIAREQEFNKNKPANVERIAKLRVWRYVRYDHASHTVDVRYFEAAGENQRSLFDFLMHTWGKVEGRLSYGVPKLVLWDKGSANTSAGIRRMLDALGVQTITHAAEHSNVKGGVENGNRLVEGHFETRLRLEPVASVAELNAAAARWVRDWNAGLLRGSKFRCADGCERTRDAMWQTIIRAPGALIELPDAKACAWFMRGADEQRQVRSGLGPHGPAISFAHPQLGRSAVYDLSPWARDVWNGQKLRVAPLLIGEAGLLRVWLPSADGSERFIDVPPITAFDERGAFLDAAVIGEEWRRAPQTAAGHAADRLAAVAFGKGVNAEEAEKRIAKQERPFQHMNDGKGAIAHSHLGKAPLPARLLPKAGEVATPEMQAARTAQPAPRFLSQFEAVKALAAPEYLGSRLTPEQVALLRRLHPDGVPEDALPALADQLRTRGALRAVQGGAA